MVCPHCQHANPDGAPSCDRCGATLARGCRQCGEALGPAAGRRVWDLYAGIGETTAALTRAGAGVESVESDPRAVAEAEARGPRARRWEQRGRRGRRVG